MRSPASMLSPLLALCAAVVLAVGAAAYASPTGLTEAAKLETTMLELASVGDFSVATGSEMSACGLIAAGVLAGAVAVILLATGCLRGGRRRIVLASFLASIVLAVGVTWLLWRVEHTIVVDEPESEAVVLPRIVSTPQDMDDLIQRCDADPGLKAVPTGVYVSSLRFEADKNKAFVTGFVWQVYPASTPGEKRGFIIERVEAIETVPVYERRDGDAVRLCWRFQAEMKVAFNFARYPFDSKNLALILYPSSLDPGLVFVPDLAAYADLLPGAGPGLGPLSVSDWTPSGSFFTFRETAYGTNFGVVGASPTRKLPEMGFSILLDRDSIDPLVVHLSSLLVVMFLQFFLVLGATGDRERAKDERYSNKGFILAAICTYFILILIHVHGLRGEIMSSELTFLDYCYFIAYAVVLLSCANVLMILYGEPRRIWLYKDNLVAKAAYWPVTLALTLAATLGVFY